MSGKLVPSKSTVYISNLAFALTNNDLHKLLEKHGQVVRVTIVKDRLTRQSKGVAFALFLTREAASACAAALNGRELFGRTLKASLARDNGRAAEFVRRREYPDKARCFECGEPGHLSYACPRNALGERPPPPKKPRKKKKKKVEPAADVEEEEEDECEDPREWSLAAAIEDEHDARQRQREGVLPRGDEPTKGHRQVVRDAYFSDEE